MAAHRLLTEEISSTPNMSGSAPTTPGGLPSAVTPMRLPKLMTATFLGQGEDILWEARPSAFLYLVGPTIFLIFVVIVNLYIQNFVTTSPLFHTLPWPSSFPSYSWSNNSVEVIVGIILLLIAVLYYGVKWLQRARTVYAVTTTRVIRQKGILGKDFDEIQLGQVRGIDVKQSLLQRLLGYGTVRVSAEGGAPGSLGNEDWVGLIHPLKFQRCIENAQESLRGGAGQIPQPRR